MAANLTKIELKTTTMTLTGQDAEGNIVEKEQPFEYKKQILSALNERPIDPRTNQQRPFGPIEMRHRLKLIDKVTEATTEVLLEKSEYKELKEAINAVGWLIVNKTIVQYLDDIEKAVEVPVVASE